MRLCAISSLCGIVLLALMGCDKKDGPASQAPHSAETQQESAAPQQIPAAMQLPATTSQAMPIQQAVAAPPPTTLTTPDWNSLAWPLGIDAYYLEANAAAGIADFFIEMELYVNGKQPRGFPRLIANGKADNIHPLQLNLALYLQDDPADASQSKITRVLGWGGQRNSDERHSQISRSHFFLNKRVLDFGHSGSHGTFNNPIRASGRTPLFYIISAGRNPTDLVTIASAQTPEELVAKNPEASILIFYIRTEARTPQTADAQG